MPPTSPSPAARASQARARRRSVPRGCHAVWDVAARRFDPVALLLAQDADRLPELVPVRHQRMAESPFAFFRGSAALMAADLATTPCSGLEVQLCGDAHLANFGTFASAERVQVFDINDFDETHPGPFEWDVKRLAASVVIAVREHGYDDAAGRAAALRCVRQYREQLQVFAQVGALDAWYAQLSLEELAAAASPKVRREVERVGARAARRTSGRALGRLSEVVDGVRRFRSDPPYLVPARELTRGGLDVTTTVQAVFDAYAGTLDWERQRLLRRFDVLDVALKVVGVGSVGTRCWVLLLQDRDAGVPLVLQVKEAGRSVLEPFLGPSEFAHQGERVVRGQRLLQASGDILLGWTQGPEGRHFYLRQLHDRKGSFDLAGLTAEGFARYARVCGWTLAHAHARSGSALELAAYLGASSRFEQAVADFALAYADQAAADHAAFARAVGAAPSAPG